MEVLCPLYMESRSSPELTWVGRTLKENVEVHEGFSGPGLEVASYCFHHIFLARTWSSGPTLVSGSMRNVVSV